MGWVRYIIQLFINVNKGAFGIIISYLRMQNNNVLNLDNWSTDWSFPLCVGVGGGVGEGCYMLCY